MSKATLAIEFVVLFVGLPLAYRFLPIHVSPLPVLWMAAIYCCLTLRRDRSFSMTRLWDISSASGQLKSILLIFIIIATTLSIVVRWLAPELLWGLVRQHPRLWAVIMMGYPALSVYPQSIVYRAFLMHRYAGFVPSKGPENDGQALHLILLSALAFAFMHIIFHNVLAVIMTFAGGLLFSWRYWVSRSLVVSAFEHALYGCFLFTVGLGGYFYHGHFQV
jgi:membrane protease YdiL (CAAX protease family)